MGKDEIFVSVRVIAETSTGKQYYVREDLGIAIDPDIEQSVKDKIMLCGLKTEWLE